MSTPKNLHSFYDRFNGHDIANKEGQVYARRRGLKLSGSLSVTDEGSLSDIIKFSLGDTYGYTKSSTETLSGSTGTIATIMPETTVGPINSGTIGFEAHVMEQSIVDQKTSVHYLRGNMILLGTGSITGTINRHETIIEETGRNSKFDISTSGVDFTIDLRSSDDSNECLYKTYFISDETNAFYINNKKYISPRPKKRVPTLNYLPGAFGRQIIDKNGNNVTKRTTYEFDESFDLIRNQNGLTIGHQGHIIPFQTSSIAILSGTVSADVFKLDYKPSGSWSWRGLVCVGKNDDVDSWTRYRIGGTIVNASVDNTTSGSVGWLSETDVLSDSSISFSGSLEGGKYIVQAIQTSASNPEQLMWVSHAAINWSELNLTSSLKIGIFDNTTQNFIKQAQCPMITFNGTKYPATRLIFSSSYDIEDNISENATVVKFNKNVAVNSGSFKAKAIDGNETVLTKGIIPPNTNYNFIGLPIDSMLSYNETGGEDGSGFVTSRGMLIMSGGVIASSSFVDDPTLYPITKTITSSIGTLQASISSSQGNMTRSHIRMPISSFSGPIFTYNG